MASDVIAAPDVGARVQVGIDAAIVANHQVCVRHLEPDGGVRTERFHGPPTLAGLSTLSRRLSALLDVTAVAEPTSMTWLPLAPALLEAGGQLSLVGSRHPDTQGGCAARSREEHLRCHRRRRARAGR